jgi:hypothetical protein
MIKVRYHLGYGKRNRNFAHHVFGPLRERIDAALGLFTLLFRRIVVVIHHNMTRKFCAYSCRRRAD